MLRSFDFNSFERDCPLNHQQVIQNLVSRYFADNSAKRKGKVAQNLEAIVNATFALAAEMGYAKMSMRDLHRRSGLSLGGLYNYFASKEALAMMMTDTLQHIAFDWLPSTLETSMNKEQQLERLVRGHIYLSQILRPWFYFVFMEIKNLPEENRAKARAVELDFQNRIEAIVGQGTLPASHIMALMQDWHVKHWKYRDTPIDEFADSVLAIALKCIENKHLQ